MKIIDDTTRRAGVEQTIRFVDSLQVWEREFTLHKATKKYLRYVLELDQQIFDIAVPLFLLSNPNFPPQRLLISLSISRDSLRTNDLQKETRTLGKGPQICEYKFKEEMVNSRKYYLSHEVQNYSLYIPNELFAKASTPNHLFLQVSELEHDEILLIPGIDPNDDLLKPDFARGEEWLTRNRLRNFEQTLNKYNLSVSHDLSAYPYKCWLELSKRRRYQVPSQGLGESLTSSRIYDLIDLRIIRFVQEGISTPGIKLRYLFSEPGIVGIVRINPSGSIEGFHEYSESPLFMAIIKGIAFSYFRDLVIPGKVVIKKRDEMAKHQPSYSQGLEAPTPKSKRQIPRTQTIEIGSSSVHTIEEWQSAQDGEGSVVVGHPRWERPGFRASQEKQNQAKNAGVRLPIGYTWVVEHVRGKTNQRFHPNKGDSIQRILFSPPIRASQELDRLLS